MTDQTRSRVKLTTVLAVVTALIVIVLVVLHNMQNAVDVRTAAVSYQDLIATAVTVGKVESTPGTEFQAHAGAAGLVEKILVKVGQSVRPGQLLIQMDDSDATAKLASANAGLKEQQALQQNMQQGGSVEERNKFKTDLAAAEMRHATAERNLTYAQSLQKQGAASGNEVARAQQQVTTSQQEIDAIQLQMNNRYSPADNASRKAQIADAEAAVNAANSAISGANIHSPIAGTVYSIDVAPHDFVSDGQELLKLADLTKMQVRGYFDEPDIGKLAVGQPVTITWEARSGITWHGHVIQVPTNVTAYGTRNVGAAIVSVDDSHGDLEPNASARLTVTTQRRPHVLSVPREALRTEGLRDFVYVVQNGRLVKTPVQVGVANTNWMEITSGLSEGQQIALGAVSSTRDLVDGMEVKTVQ